MTKLSPSDFRPAPTVLDRDVFVVTRNSDLTEGNGYDMDIGYYDDFDEALTAARRVSTQGSDGNIYKLTEVNPDKRFMYWGRWYDWDNHKVVYGFRNKEN